MRVAHITARSWVRDSFHNGMPISAQSGPASRASLMAFALDPLLLGRAPALQTHGQLRKQLCRGIAGFVFLLAATAAASFGQTGGTRSQDNGSAVSEFRGNGAEVTVTVKDGSGEPLGSAAMVKIFRDGNIPTGQSQTSRGHAIFVVNSLGEYTVDVAVPGYTEVRKDVSLQSSGRFEVEVTVRRMDAGMTTGVPGRPLLAPKAKEAVDKGLEALSADKLRDAEKYVGRAVELAPGHPDVLYLQGVLSLKERNWAQAQSALEKATQIDPNHAQAFAALGMAFCDQGKYDAAIPPLKKSLELNAAASAWEARWALAKAEYHQGAYEDALKMSNDALAASNGKAPEIGLLVAESLTAVGHYEEAATLLRTFVKEHGDRKEAATARRWLEQLTNSGKIRAN
jgi:thioredoxin-like negative regulator of GroEL